jgi:hypothetical protein
MPFSFTGFGAMAILFMVLFLTVLQVAKKQPPVKR